MLLWYLTTLTKYHSRAKTHYRSLPDEALSQSDASEAFRTKNT